MTVSNHQYSENTFHWLVQFCTKSTTGTEKNDPHKVKTDFPIFMLHVEGNQTYICIVFWGLKWGENLQDVFADGMSVTTLYL